MKEKPCPLENLGEKWAELWWLWCYSQPYDSNPISDPTGKFSANNQIYEEVWFLGWHVSGVEQREPVKSLQDEPYFFQS